nr:RteC domain-containing protein [Gelidibacter algens]
MVQRSNRSIAVCTNLLGELKKEIVTNGFECDSDEIYFFKKLKQIPLRHLIYFSEIRSFEIQFPKADKDCQRKFIRKKYKKLTVFLFIIWTLLITLIQNTPILIRNTTLGNLWILTE